VLTKLAATRWNEITPKVISPMVLRAQDIANA
jgi:hypothetical protein